MTLIATGKNIAHRTMCKMLFTSQAFSRKFIKYNEKIV